jgi:hypothetical protein
MKRHILVLPGLVLVVLCVILSAGCTSAPDTHAVTPAQTVVPTVNPVTETATPVASVTTMTSPQTPVPLSTYTNTKYGITLRYPATWTYIEPDTVGMRIYGRTTMNIANFSVPGADNDSLSIDIDPGYTGTLDNYFNLASLATQSSVVQQNLTYVQSSSTFEGSISGHTAYRLQYTIETLEKYPVAVYSQIYTLVDGNMYIFTYSGITYGDIVSIQPTNSTGATPAP